MSTGALAEMPAGLDLTVTDLAVLFIATLLTFNAVARIRKTRLQNPGLLRANIAMIAVLICSVSVVYDVVDPVLGGRSLLNCIAHLLMVYTGWEIAASTALMLNRFDQRPARSLLVNPWVALISAAGTIAAYIALNPSSSRGLEDYDHEVAYVLYWAATMAPLVLGALHLVPRMAKIMPLLREAQWLTTASLVLLWLSFIGVLLCLLMYVATAMLPELYVTREIVVNGTLLMFTAAFLMATAALPRCPGRRSRRLRPVRNHSEPQ